MSYDVDKFTEKELARLEERMKREYAKVAAELKKTYDEYINGYKDENGIYHKGLNERIAEQYVEYKKGKYSDEQWKQWQYAQLGRGERWNDCKEQMAKRLTETNLITQAYVNDKLPSIFVANSNSVAQIAKDAAMDQGVTGIKFDLADEYTVKRLMAGSREVRPYKKLELNIKNDVKWNAGKIQNALLEGILQGDSIDHIAKRFENVAGLNRVAAVRNARTAVTGAQGAGKQDRYEDLAKQGCKCTKIWVATDDERTRPEHTEADGQEVNYDEFFDVGEEELQYPGDPAGSGWNIYNCRCTTRAGRITFSSVLADNADIKIVGDNTQADNTNTVQSLYSPNYDSDLAKKCGNDYYDELHNRVMACENEELRDVWKAYEDRIIVADTNTRGTAYCDFKPSIHINTASDAKGKSYEAPYQVTFHESGHAIDMMARDKGSGAGWYYSQTYKNGLFPDTIKKELDDWVKGVDTVMKAEFKAHKGDYVWLHDNGYISDLSYSYYERFGSFIGGEPKYSKSIAYKAIERDLRQIPSIQRGDLSDIIEGATKGKISLGIGHGVSYWKDGSKLATEAFAEMTSSSMANAGSLETIKKYLPKSYGIYEEMIGALRNG